MTIQEAIKSGKPFRRAIWNKNLWLVESKGIVCDNSIRLEIIRFSVPDILADDWEIKENGHDKRTDGT